MSKKKFFWVSIFVGVIVMANLSDEASAQRPGTHTDESKVPSFQLPEVLVCADGTAISTQQAWREKRRPELLQLFSDHVYGNVPEGKLQFKMHETKSWEIFDGTAIRKEVKIQFGESPNVIATMLLTIPKLDHPVPCFLGYNFDGNHTTTDDPKVSKTKSWVHNKKKLGIDDNRASNESRGVAASRWPYAEIVKEGFAVATIYYGDIDPDFDDQFQNGIQPLFYKDGQTKPSLHQWGSIGAWAWSLSRALDCLKTEPLIDFEHVAVIGHSRLGKTSLWAGATDERFWLTISNNSGCGGAALHRRKFGETVKVINTNFPHWFCDQFVAYNEKENEVPVDQHQLMALIAPRLVYVASASGDLWADPKGEFLSLANSNPVFTLYGEAEMTTEFPAAEKPHIVGSRGYHLRNGKHDIKLYDWQQYMEFAKQNLKPE